MTSLGDEGNEVTPLNNDYDYDGCLRSETSEDSNMKSVLPSYIKISTNVCKNENTKKIIIAQIVVLLYGIAKTVVLLSNAQFIHHVIKQEMKGGGNATINGSSTCFRNASEPAFAIDTLIQQKTSFKSLQFSLANNGITAFVSLFMGAYSDQIGRKYLFLLPMCGTCIQSTTYALVSYFKAPLNFLFIGEISCGLCGGFVTFFLACFALTSDLTVGKTNRSFHIAAFECIGYFSIGISMLSVGYILKYLSFTVAFAISVALTIIGILVIIIFLKNPHSTRTTLIKPNFKNLAYNIYHFYTSNEEGTRLMFQVCLLVFTFATFSGSTAFSMYSVYLLGRPLCYDSVQIGYFTAGLTLIGAIASMIYVFVMQRCISEITIGIGGAISFTAFLVLMSFSKTTAQLFIAVAVGSLGVSAVGMVRAIMSKLTPQGQHGALFAGLSCTEAIIATLSCVISNAIYAKTVATFSGAVFFIMSCFYGFTVLLFIILWFVIRRASRDPDQEPILNHENPEM